MSRSVSSPRGAAIVDDDERADALPRHQRRGLASDAVGDDAPRIADHAVLGSLDDLDLLHLRLDVAGRNPRDR